ncbi:MAG: hypothetical protein LBS90_05770 [Oscillospiraceae bacterium]|jgi:peptidoglycan/LPS O-acetylase OafA/YrhL|nr:hypothetical protein [Oscillospiraceae bacterium]
MKRTAKPTALPFAVTAAVYALMALWGLSGITGDELGYSMLCFFIAAPVTELVCGFFTRRSGLRVRLIYPLTGLLNYAVAFIVFGRAGHFIPGEFIMLTAAGVGFAAIGVAAGTLSAKRRRAKSADKMSARDL